jgi:hypothetical protein
MAMEFVFFCFRKLEERNSMMMHVREALKMGRRPIVG